MLPTFQLAACNLSAQTHSQRGALNVSAGIFSILSAWPGDRSSLRLARRISLEHRILDHGFKRGGPQQQALRDRSDFFWAIDPIGPRALLR